MIERRVLRLAIVGSLLACGRIDLGSYGSVEPDAGDLSSAPPVGPGRAGSGGSASMLGNDLGGAGGAGPIGGGSGSGGVSATGGTAGGNSSAGGSSAGSSSSAGGSSPSGGSGGGPIEAGVDPREPPSCAAGLTCGPEGDSCCARELVPFGSFERGGPIDAGGTVAYVDSFFLDKYEVTVGRFQAFIADYETWRERGHPEEGEGAAGAPDTGWHTRWNNGLPESSSQLAERVTECVGAPFSTLRDTRLYPVEVPLDNEQMPINCVSWFEAMAFCVWDGARLPTELEWEYAAAGGEKNRRYPWGEELTRDRAEFNCGTNIAGVSNSMTLTVGDGGPDASVTYSFCDMTTLPRVGSKPLGEGFFHQRDLAGSMAEWVFDGGALYPPECTNCAETDIENHRMFRGGSWFDIYDTFFDRTQRSGSDAAGRWHFVGFRCARANYR